MYSPLVLSGQCSFFFIRKKNTYSKFDDQSTITTLLKEKIVISIPFIYMAYIRCVYGRSDMDSIDNHFGILECRAEMINSDYLIASAENMLAICRKRVSKGAIYLGSAGCAYVQLRHALVQMDTGTAEVEAELRSAIRRANKSFEFISSRKVTLLEGQPGPIMLLLWAGAILNDKDIVDSAWRDMQLICPRVLGMPREECEVLYGRCGFLQALLACQEYQKFKNIDLIRHDACKAIISQVYEEGLRVSQQTKEESQGRLNFPLCWRWHGKIYLGAAHGVSGILYTLLLFHTQLQEISGGHGLDLVWRTVQYMVDNFSFASGNLQSSASTKSSSHFASSRDRLVQWCHGAPGLVHLVCLCTRIYPTNVEWCLEAAERACEVIWERGLLRKGLGLCHGISGSAYCFTTLARALHEHGSICEKRGDAERAARCTERYNVYMLR
jgi:hypothetical protein